MKKSDVRDLTIKPAETRTVGDVTSISAGDTAKAGANSPDLGVDAPNYMANPGVSDGKGQNDYIPSGEGDANRAADEIPGQAPNVPDASAGMPKEESSVNSGPYGKRVSWPSAADGTSAGGAGSTTTLVQKTGSVVKFPSASDTTSAGGVKDCMSFAKDGKDW